VISGFVEKGGAEDRALIMTIRQAWTVTGTEGRLQSILVAGKSGQLETIGAAIRSALDNAAVKTVRQVALAEEVAPRQIQLLMMLVTLVVIFASAISVTSTMGANVLEGEKRSGS